MSDSISGAVETSIAQGTTAIRTPMAMPTDTNAAIFDEFMRKLDPPITAQELQQFEKETGRPPTSSRETYVWITSLRSKQTLPLQALGNLPSVGTFSGDSDANTIALKMIQMANQITPGTYQQLSSIIKRVLEPVLVPVLAPVQELKSGLLDPIVTMVPGPQGKVGKVTGIAKTATGTPFQTTGVRKNPGTGMTGGAPPRPAGPWQSGMKVSTPSIMQQITTSLSNIDGNTANITSMYDRVVALDENVKALLDAFNAANASKSQTTDSSSYTQAENNSQEGGRRRQTKAKRKPRARRRTRR